QAEDGIRDRNVTGVQTCALPISKEYSPNYVRIIQGMLSLAFDRAIILGLASKNPSRMVGNIKSKKVKIDFWTLDEFQKVISLLRSEERRVGKEIGCRRLPSLTNT